MWGITSRSRTQLRIFRNAFRGKSSKDRYDNYKENYGYYVSIKRRIRKRLRNIRNRLQNIRDIFLIFENPQEFFFCIFKGKIKNLTLFTNFHLPKHYNQTSNQLPDSQIWKEPPSTTRELNPGPLAPLTSLFPLDHASFLWKFAELSNIKWKLIKEKDYGISVIH